MTGQLFVVPAGAPADRARPPAPWPSTTGASCASATSASSAGSALWPRDPATGAAARRARRRRSSSPGTARSRSTRPSRCGAFRARLRARRGRLKPLLLDQAFVAGRRQHLRRRGALAGAPPPAPLGGDAPAGRRAAPPPRDPGGPRRGGRAAGLVDRRLHRPRRRRRRCRSACASTSEPASRARAAGGRSGGSWSGGRATHFCSWCQRLPAADRPGAAAILRAARAPRRGAPGPSWRATLATAAGAGSVAGAGRTRPP